MSMLTVGPLRREASTGAATATHPGPPITAPIHQRPQRPPLRLVDPPARRRRRVHVGVVGTGALVMILIGIFLLAAVHTMVVQAQFELDQVEQQVEVTRSELDGLRLQVAQLESPQAIVRSAVSIGMLNPPDRIYLEPVVTERAVIGTGATLGDTTP